MHTLHKLERTIANFPIDRNFLPQEQLDIVQRRKTSLYPWRGQFSPGLVELLLDTYAEENSIILDPFVGSGTTLFEATMRGLRCYGIEINPAAVQLASMAKFANVPKNSRKPIFARAEALLEEQIDYLLPANLFQELHTDDHTEKSVETVITTLLNRSEDDRLRTLLITSIMLAMGNGSTLDGKHLLSAYQQNRAIVANLPYSSRPCDVFWGDARSLPLENQSVDIVITSPPYINVFNYHQNYRKAMELMGWHLLKVAPSEIGSNRKHRSNRFMTVVQYCMDLTQTFIELRRILRSDGFAIFVIGRESRVRDVPFNNGELLALVAVGGAGFCLERWQERKFTNRFGEAIYEEILTLQPIEAHLCGSALDAPEEFGRKVGILALENAFSRTDTGKEEVYEDIMQAINRSETIKPSPINHSPKDSS